MSSSDAIVAFYRNTGRDGAGRTLAEVHAFTDDELETHHDFIQWLFPLRERSAFNPSAPVLDDAVIAEFRTDPALRAALRRSLDVMLRFYGLQSTVVAGRETITTGPAFTARSRAWITPGNHNFLRLTRILGSLCLLGERERAVALFECLQAMHLWHADVIGAHTLRYWADAVD